MKKLPVFCFKQASFLTLSAAILCFYCPIGGHIDLALISPWAGQTGDFPLRDNWYLTELNHRYVKLIIIYIYAFYFLTWLASFKFEKLKNKRAEYAYFFFVSMICTLSIGLIKAHSNQACPWNMTTPNPLGFTWNFTVKDGHCFPGGHASTGFALMTGYFVYLKSNSKRAYFFLIAGIALGFLMGWAQMMRGAHFLSHNLWTAWITWFINIIIYLFIQYYQKLKIWQNTIK